MTWRSVAVVAGLAYGCGSGSGAPTTPTPPVTTITITATSVTPKTVQIGLGERVRFVNQDAAPHSIGSDPHPDHTDCPEINQVGFLSAGQSRETGNFVQPRTCGFHDHDNPTAARWTGTIVVK